MDILLEFYSQALKPENLFELGTIVTVYFVAARFGGFFIDSYFKKLKKWFDEKGWGKSKIMNYALIIMQLMIIILFTYSVRLFSLNSALSWVSNDEQLYLKNAIGIVFAFIEFSTQAHLKDMMKKL